MIQFLTRTSSFFALALSFAFVAEGSAQQPPAVPTIPAVPEAPAAQCTAQVDPAQVPAGQAAVKIAFTLSSAIGSVTGIEAPEGSGLALAATQDIPRAAMANPDQEARPIELAAETNTVTVWLKTAGVQAGDFDLKLKGENDRTCNTKVKVG